MKLKRVDGAHEFTLSLAYEQYAAVDGVIDAPEGVAMWAVGTGLYEMVKDEPVVKPSAKKAATKEVEAQEDN